MQASSNPFAQALYLVVFYGVVVFGSTTPKEQSNGEDFDAKMLCQPSERGYYAAHPLDCQKYIICISDGNALEGSCEPNYYNIINDKLGECLPQEQVNCGQRKIPEHLKPEVKPSIVVTPPHLGNPLSSKDEAWREQMDCNNQKDGFYNIPNQCHKFLHCQDGSSYVKDCPDNLVYDELTTQRGQAACNYLENTKRTDCGAAITSDKPALQLSGHAEVQEWMNQLPCSGLRDGKHAIPKHCGLYYTCLSDKNVGAQPCHIGTAFEAREGAEGDCFNGEQISRQDCEQKKYCEIHGAGKHATLSNACDRYINCDTNKSIAYELDCPAGTVFEYSNEEQIFRCVSLRRTSRVDCKTQRPNTTKNSDL